MERGSFELMKKMNQQVVLKLIYKKKAISRAEIAELSGLSPATITNIVKELMEMELIKETSRGESRGGRKPVLLEINPRGAYFIGLEWGIGEIRGVLLDLNKMVVGQQEVKVDSFKLDSFIELSSKIVSNLIKYPIKKDKIYGLGVGVHGMVDPEKGYSLFAPHFKWRNLAVKSRLEVEFKLPVLIDNDVRAMALAEKWNGRDNFLLINTGPGIGAAIVLNGRLHYGRDYSAGEFGHMTVVKEGPLCSCGNTGCLEALVSTDSLVHRYNPEIKGEISQKKLHEMWLELLSDAKDGRREAVEIIEDTAEYLGMGIANLTNLLNPDEIILAGEYIEGVDILLPLLKKRVKEKTLPIPGRELTLAVSDFGEWVGAIGSATMVLQELFDFQGGFK